MAKPAQAKPVKRKVGRPPGTSATGRSAGGRASVGRDLLIDVTCELLKTTQPAEISRALVARTSGVDPSLIRYYFSNRMTLLVAAAQRLTDRYSKMVEEATARSDGSPTSILRERIRALVDLIAEYPYFHRLFVDVIMSSENEDARAIFSAVIARGLSGYEAILLTGKKQGEFGEVDGAMLFTAIIGLSEFYLPGIRVIEQARGTESPELRLRDEYTDFVCNLIINGIARRPTTKASAQPREAKPRARVRYAKT